MYTGHWVDSPLSFMKSACKIQGVRQESKYGCGTDLLRGQHASGDQISGLGFDTYCGQMWFKKKDILGK